MVTIQFADTALLAFKQHVKYIAYYNVIEGLTYDLLALFTSERINHFPEELYTTPEVYVMGYNNDDTFSHVVLRIS